MKRVVMFVFALAVFGLGGVVRAEESSSAESPVVAQAQAPAHSGDDRPAMLSDIRDAENRINARIDGVEARMNAKIDGVETRMNAQIGGVEMRMNARMDRMDNQMESLRGDIRAIQNGLYAILAAIVAGVIGMLVKDRRNIGTPAIAVVLGMLTVAGIVMASA